MREMGNWREYQIRRLANDRETAIDYLQLTLEEYLADGDLTFFLKEFRVFIESQGGVVEISKRTGIDTETLLNMLSNEETPRLDTFQTLLNALKRCLVIEHLVKYKRQLRDMRDAVKFNHVDPLVDTHVSLEVATYLS